jgi:hypothetical protein
VERFETGDITDELVPGVQLFGLLAVTRFLPLHGEAEIGGALPVIGR